MGHFTGSCSVKDKISYNYIMSFVNCNTSYTLNEDGSSSFTVNMNNVTTKCMQSFCADPEEWIKNAIEARSQDEGNRIYKLQLERHLEAGTMPTNPTKESLILEYEIPTEETTPLPE